MKVANPRSINPQIFMYNLIPNRLEMLTQGPTPEEMQIAGQHWEYSKQLLKIGTIIFGGRTLLTTQESHAVVVIKAENVEEATNIMNNDPAVKNGVFSAKLYPFQLMMMGDWPMDVEEESL